MNWISPAALITLGALDYLAKGAVVRVFVKNSYGDLIPDEYAGHDDSNKFTLRNSALGEVYAEVVKSRVVD